mgnify:CR=1 FL=1
MAAIVSAIEDGGYSRTLGDRLSALEHEKESLTALVAAGPAPTLRIHPRLADVYAEKVAKLEVALNDPVIRDDSSELIRSLTSEITLPHEDESGVDAVLMETSLPSSPFAMPRSTKANSPELARQGVHCRWLRGQDLNL